MSWKERKKTDSLNMTWSTQSILILLYFYLVSLIFEQSTTRKLFLFSGHACMQRLATILLAKKQNADHVPEHLCCYPYFLNNCSIFCLSCCFAYNFISISFHNVTLSLSLSLSLSLYIHTYIYIYIYIYISLYLQL